MITISIDNRWRVHASAELEIPLPAPTVWGQIRGCPSLHRDRPAPCRCRITCIADSSSFRRRNTDHPSPHPRDRPHQSGAGSSLARGFGVRVQRPVERGVGVGFPHICGYGVVPRRPRPLASGRDHPRKWTAVLIPRRSSGSGFDGCCSRTESRISLEFARFAAWRAERGAVGAETVPALALADFALTPLTSLAPSPWPDQDHAPLTWQWHRSSPPTRVLDRRSLRSQVPNDLPTGWRDRARTCSSGVRRVMPSSALGRSAPVKWVAMERWKRRQPQHSRLAHRQRTDQPFWRARREQVDDRLGRGQFADLVLTATPKAKRLSAMSLAGSVKIRGTPAQAGRS